MRRLAMKFNFIVVIILVTFTQGTAYSRSDANKNLSPVIKHLGEQFHYALMVAAANPEQQFTPGSRGDRARKLLNKLSSADRQGVSQRSKNFVSKTESEQKTMFTSSRDLNIQELPHQTMWQMNATTEKMFKRDLRKRIAHYRPLVEKILGEKTGPVEMSASNQDSTIQSMSYLDGAIQNESLIYKREFNLNSPEKMFFKFRSNALNIKQVVWELRRKESKRLPEKLLRSGTTPATQEGTSTHSTFRLLNLADYWPANSTIGQPPGFYVRAIAVGEDKKKVGRVGDSKITSGKIKRAAENPDTTPDNSIGLWSNRVVINYSEENHPATKFDEHYNQAEFRLNKVELFRKSSESGEEHFSIRGFIKSMSPTFQFGHKCFFTDYVELTNEGESASVDDKCTFDLPIHKDAYPRLYTVVMAGYEIDENGPVRELFDLIDDAYDNNPFSEDMRREFTEELRKQLREDFEDYVEEDIKAAISLIISIMENDYYIELIRFLFTLIGGAYDLVAPDDPYGPTIVSFALTSNNANSADQQNVFFGDHNIGVSLKSGFLSSNRAGGEITAPYKIPLVGYGVGAVGNFDGWYNIHSKWILSDKR